jgi:hypothetical protein
MVRSAFTLATILGLVACPLVCIGRAGASSDQGCCGSCCCQDRPFNCCEEEDDDCLAGCPSRPAIPLPDDCKAHPCICAGAVATRDDLPLDIAPRAEIFSPVPAVLSGSDLPAWGPVYLAGESPPFPRLPSGHAIRLAMESLLL